jgi:hypothetical protein
MHRQSGQGEEAADRRRAGHAVGVATTMLLHCDLVYPEGNARLITPFVNLALVPEAASSWLLPARIGHLSHGRPSTKRHALALRVQAVFCWYHYAGRPSGP